MELEMLKALNPKISIKVTDLDGKAVPVTIITNIYELFNNRYQALLDIKNETIYLGKKL